jgi:hypothetical protein
MYLYLLISSRLSRGDCTILHINAAKTLDVTPKRAYIHARARAHTNIDDFPNFNFSSSIDLPRRQTFYGFSALNLIHFKDVVKILD